MLRGQPAGLAQDDADTEMGQRHVAPEPDDGGVVADQPLLQLPRRVELLGRAGQRFRVEPQDSGVVVVEGQLAREIEVGRVLAPQSLLDFPRRLVSPDRIGRPSQLLRVQVSNVAMAGCQFALEAGDVRMVEDQRRRIFRAASSASIASLVRPVAKKEMPMMLWLRARADWRTMSSGASAARAARISRACSRRRRPSVGRPVARSSLDSESHTPANARRAPSPAGGPPSPAATTARARR